MAWSIVGDGSIGSPSAHIRSFQLSQSSLSACPDKRLALGPRLGRLRGEDVGHRPRLAEFLVQSLAVASGEGRRVVLRRHPDIHDSGRATGGAGDYSNEGQQPSSSWRPVRCLAGIVQQPLSDILPDRLCAVKPNGIGLLDFDDPAAAGAGDPQNMLGNFGQPQRPDGRARRHRAGAGERVPQDGFPVFGRHGSPGPGVGVLRGSLPTAAASFSICFGVGMRQLAGRSVIPELEHNKNIESSPPIVGAKK